MHDDTAASARSIELGAWAWDDDYLYFLDLFLLVNLPLDMHNSCYSPVDYCKATFTCAIHGFAWLLQNFACTYVHHELAMRLALGSRAFVGFVVGSQPYLCDRLVPDLELLWKIEREGKKLFCAARNLLLFLLSQWKTKARRGAAPSTGLCHPSNATPK